MCISKSNKKEKMLKEFIIKAPLENKYKDYTPELNIYDITSGAQESNTYLFAIGKIKQ